MARTQGESSTLQQSCLRVSISQTHFRKSSMSGIPIRSAWALCSSTFALLLRMRGAIVSEETAYLPPLGVVMCHPQAVLLYVQLPVVRPPAASSRSSPRTEPSGSLRPTAGRRSREPRSGELTTGERQSTATNCRGSCLYKVVLARSPTMTSDVSFRRLVSPSPLR